jgi:MFS family permease
MEAEFRKRIPILVVLCMTQFMIPFDYMSITLSLITIRDNLGMPSEIMPWIMSSYLLTFGGVLLLGGKLADTFGRRRILVIGLLVFATFSVVTAMTNSPTTFLMARAVKGIGSALICPAMLALLNRSFPNEHDRHRALAAYWFFSALGAATGTGVGGYLTEHSWRLTLLVNVPIALVLAYCIPRVVEESWPAGASRRLDYVGALCSTIGIGTLIFGVSNGLRVGLTPFTTASLLISVTALCLLWRVEQRHESPLLPPHLFKLRNLVGANIFCFFWAAANSKYLLAGFFQEVQQYSSGAAGLALLPHSATSLMTAFIAVKMMDRFGALKSMLIGATIEGVAILGLCTVSPGTSYLVLVACVIGIAFGVSLAGIAAKLPACWDAAEEDQGVASAMIFSTQQLANAFAIPVYAAVLETTTGWYSSSGDMALSHGYRFAFGTALLYIVVAAIAAFVIIRPRTKAASTVLAEAKS